MGVAVGLTLLVAVPGTAHPAGAQTAGDVRPNAEGWWDVAVAVPTTPVGGNAPSISAPRPDVPEGVLPVTLRFGQPSRVSAIGIEVTAPQGSTVNSMVLTLKESTASGSQQGSGGGVKACPITTFLVPVENGKARDAPASDCGLGEAVGERAEDGTWTFDLTTIAQAWLDPFQGVPPQGVRLDPVGSSPATFQVGFTGLDDATVAADITAADAAEDPFSTGGALGGSSGGDFGTGGGDFATGGGSLGGDFAAPAAPAPSVGDPASGGGTDASGPDAGGERVAAPVVASRAGDTFGNLPLSVLPATLGTIVLAVLAALALGPGGGQRPDAARRQGGVSRVLADRLATTRARRG